MYATIDEIKARSKRVPELLEASNSEIRIWMEDAMDAINAFCSQDFSFEPQLTKRVLLDGSLVVLPKPLSGKVSATVEGGDQVPSSDLEHVAGEAMLRYRPLNVAPWGYATRNPDYLLITGDWGYASSQEDLIVTYANELKAKYEVHRQDTGAHNAADVTNIVTSADATDLATAVTLLNELRTLLLAHFADVVVHSVADVQTISSTAATDELSAKLLARELDSVYLTHLYDSEVHVLIPTDLTTLPSTTTSVDSFIMPRVVKKVFIRLVQRLAVRDDMDDHYNRNSGYLSEKSGDGYSYDLSNGTLRNLIRPEDFQNLYEYVNHGKVVN